MISIFLLLAALPLASLTDFTPLAPGPGDIFAASSSCKIQWQADSTGQWKNVSIFLMTGPNNNMTRLRTVVSGMDGTDDSLSPFSWPCPAVDPYSAIYFYQFTNGDDIQNSKWTTRFTITSPSGESQPPEHNTQPNGDAIPWGQGRLVAGDDSPSLNRNTNNTKTATDKGIDGTAHRAASDASSSTSTDTPQKHKHHKSARPDDLSSTLPDIDPTALPIHRTTHYPTRTAETAPLRIPASAHASRIYTSHASSHTASPPYASCDTASCLQTAPGSSDRAEKLASSGSMLHVDLWPELFVLLWFMIL